MKKEDYKRLQKLFDNASKHCQSTKKEQKYKGKKKPPCKGCSGNAGKPDKSEKPKKYDRNYYKEKMLYCKKKYDQCSRYGAEADMCREYYRSKFKEYKKMYFACDK